MKDQVRCDERGGMSTLMEDEAKLGEYMGGVPDYLIKLREKKN